MRQGGEELDGLVERAQPQRGPGGQEHQFAAPVTVSVASTAGAASAAASAEFTNPRSPAQSHQNCQMGAPGKPTALLGAGSASGAVDCAAH